MTNFRLICTWATAATLCVGAIPSMASPPVPTGTSQDELFGTVLRDSKWQRMTIPVCWENPSSADSSYRLISRRAVEETWERNSSLRFVDWGTCRADSKGIRIRVQDSGPHVKALGRFLDGRPDGMVLNFTFGNWSPSCASKRDFCTYAIAAHEFGHAIGFSHEQNRPDAPDWCRELAQGTDGDYLITVYDPDSIMNYCSTKWNGDGKLSALDVQALRLFYGG